jgi:NAD(P)-dependent dehydrogenase (short-subunit alcohol dehydrogenase family)
MNEGLRCFDGAVAIVTGAGSGIGAALAEELALRGSEVVLADVDATDAEAVAERIRSRGGRASATHLDVTSAAAFEGVVVETVKRLGRLDYVFNNAGIGVAGPAADYTLDAWDRILGVNLRGVIHGVQAAYPVMIRQGFGHVVNTASMAGLTTSPGMIGYATTKHAVVALSLALRSEAAAHGIRVSVLCPGVIRTPLLQGGKHGIFLGSVPVDRQRQLVGEFFERLRPMAAPVFARKVLDRVARNRAIVIVPGWWRILWWVERASPAFTSFLARKSFERAQQLLDETSGSGQRRGSTGSLSSASAPKTHSWTR